MYLVEFYHVEDTSRMEEIRKYVQTLVDETNYEIIDIWDATDNLSANIWRDLGQLFFDVYDYPDTCKPVASGTFEEINY